METGPASFKLGKLKCNNNNVKRIPINDRHFYLDQSSHWNEHCTNPHVSVGMTDMYLRFFSFSLRELGDLNRRILATETPSNNVSTDRAVFDSERISSASPWKLQTPPERALSSFPILSHFFLTVERARQLERVTQNSPPLLRFIISCASPHVFSLFWTAHFAESKRRNRARKPKWA